MTVDTAAPARLDRTRSGGAPAPLSRSKSVVTQPTRTTPLLRSSSRVQSPGETGDRILRRSTSRVVKDDVVESAPVIAFAEYGYEWTWSLDLFSLPHNAIRKEFMDFYAVFGKFRKAGFRVEPEQMEDFKEWWKEIFEFIREYFLVEEDFLFPFLEGPYQMKGAKTNEPGDGIPRLLITARQEGYEMKRSFLTLQDEIDRTAKLPSEKRLPAIFQLVNPWVVKFLTYAAKQELELVKEVQTNFEDEDKYALDKEIVSWMLKQDRGGVNVVMLVRWIESKETLQQWIKENLTRTQALSYSRWQNNFINGHRKRLERLLEQKTAIDLTIDGKTAVHGHMALPVMVMCEFGFEWHWSRDPYSMPNNAVRRELMDLFLIIDYLRKSTRALHTTDITEFSVWWADFKIFMDVYFRLMESVLLPWVAQPAIGKAQQDFFNQYNAVSNELNGVKNKFELLDKSVFQFGSNQDGESFVEFLNRISEFVPFANTYFNKMEKCMPPLVEEFRVIEDKDALEKELVAFVMKQPNAHLNIVILSRWISDVDVLHEWMTFNLKAIHRAQYKMWTRQFIQGHRRIVENFHKRKQSLARGEAAPRPAPADEKKTPWWQGRGKGTEQASRKNAPQGWAK